MRYSANLNIMIKAVEEARVRTARDFHELEILQTNQVTAKKYANSCFLRVKNFIFDDLTKMRPEYNIFSSDGDKVINNEDPEYYFYIHPIDGLTNLSRSISEFSIAISLIFKGEQEDQSVACVIHKVIGGDLFYTENGFDCFINNRKIKCANSSKESKLIGSFNSQINEFNGKKLINRNFGCKTLELAYLAAGKIDYLEIPKEKSEIFKPFFLIATQSGATIYEENNKIILHN